MIPLDKQAHFFSGGTIAAMALPFGLAVAVVVLGVAAFGKEVYDKFHPENHTADIWDAIATLAGGALIIIWQSFVPGLLV
jgi:ABC-type nickel/cobalt efflux system permease component RcnA